MHIVSEPPILYFGTPVVVISTVNPDGSYNLAPMSSAFWLGWRCVLGLGATSQTPNNMIRTGECVLNLPSADQVASVNLLARTTGANPPSPPKLARGYRFERDKFELAGLTPVASETIAAPRVREYPVQLECVLEATRGLGEQDEYMRGRTLVLEVRVQRVHVEESILAQGEPNRIDPDKWRPLIMSFQKFYGLTGQLEESVLARIPEALYRSPDVDRARESAP